MEALAKLQELITKHQKIQEEISQTTDAKKRASLNRQLKKIARRQFKHRSSFKSKVSSKVQASGATKVQASGATRAQARASSQGGLASNAGRAKAQEE